MSRVRLSLLILALAVAIPAAAVGVDLPDNGQPRAQDMENDPDLYLQLIAGMQGKNLHFASLAHLEAFDKRWPGNARAALLRGDALRETGYLDKAAVIYRTLLASPQSAGAYHGLGIIAGRRGDPRSALANLEQASRLAPTSAPILNDLGYMQLVAGQRDEARLSLHKATELDSGNARAGGNLALLYLLEDKPERAAGIMQWYQLPESHRKEIFSQAERLTASLRRESDGK